MAALCAGCGSPPLPTAEPGPFFGWPGVTDLGTVRIPAHSIMHWRCWGCTDGILLVGNMPWDTSQIKLVLTSKFAGQMPVAGGTYHHMTVQMVGGNWELRFTHGPFRLAKG